MPDAFRFNVLFIMENPRGFLVLNAVLFLMSPPMDSFEAVASSGRFLSVPDSSGIISGKDEVSFSPTLKTESRSSRVSHLTRPAPPLPVRSWSKQMNHLS